jgi:nucleotidyltransferase/DNA polymerase involved in DNA repair
MVHRKILHLDLDAFFCAVEEQRDPTLRGKAFAVGGRPDARGVVASCSYPARKFGVRSAMPMIQAKRLCPELIIVSWNHGDYRAVSKKVMALLHDLTPLVEPLSIDEAFLDVSDIPGDPEAIARRVQSGIRADLDLPSSLGVATNKLVAKIANNIGKSSAKTESYPNAITVVAPGQEAAFLAPLPTRELWGVGPKTAERLTRLGLKTIGDIAQYPPADHFFTVVLAQHGNVYLEKDDGEEMVEHKRVALANHLFLQGKINMPGSGEGEMAEGGKDEDEQGDDIDQDGDGRQTHKSIAQQQGQNAKANLENGGDGGDRRRKFGRFISVV